MKPILTWTGLLAAGVVIGWCSHLVASNHWLKPAEVAASGWTDQVAMLTDVNGDPREPQAVVDVARTTLSTRTTMLAMHYDYLPEGEKKEIARYLARAKALPIGEGYPSNAALACIEEAGISEPMRQECISDALKINLGSK